MTTPELAALARAGADIRADREALKAVQTPAQRYVHRVSLQALAAERARGVLGAGDLQREGAALSYVGTGVCGVKASALCPPQAMRLSVRAQGRGRFALAVCDRFALMRLEGGKLTADAPFAWTGWRKAGELMLALKPFETAADVFLLSQGAASWSGLTAEVALFDFTTPSALALAAGATPLSARLLSGAELLTPAPDFPGAYFVAGDVARHHPLVGRPALVRLKRALFQGATGVQAVFGLEHEQSRPVAFALWAREAGRPARTVEELAGSPAFSGWSVVEAAFGEERLEMKFREPLRAPLDLYLATKVANFPDNNYCHAVWRELLVLEDSA